MGGGHTWGESTEDKGLGVLMAQRLIRPGRAVLPWERGSYGRFAALQLERAGLPKRLHQNSCPDAINS